MFSFLEFNYHTRSLWGIQNENCCCRQHHSIIFGWGTSFHITRWTCILRLTTAGTLYNIALNVYGTRICTLIWEFKHCVENSIRLCTILGWYEFGDKGGIRWASTFIDQHPRIVLFVECKTVFHPNTIGSIRMCKLSTDLILTTEDSLTNPSIIIEELQYNVGVLVSVTKKIKTFMRLLWYHFF